MTLYQEHQQMVTSLVKPGQAILDSMTASGANLLHMTIGIAGEVAEMVDPLVAHLFSIHDFDRKNLVEEMGDMEFYLEGFRQEAGLSREQIITLVESIECPHLKALADMDPRSRKLYTANRLHVEAGALLDKVKKQTVYNKAIPMEDYLPLLAIIEAWVIKIREDYEVSREEALEANLNKLLKGEKARYKEGTYSDEQAQERRDKVSVEA